MGNHKEGAEEVLRRVKDTLETAQHGLADLTGGDPSRRLTGLRNLVAFGRSVTFVLQNLRSVASDFDSWYAPHQDRMKASPLFRYFINARNELEKQGRLSVTNAMQLNPFSNRDIAKFGRPPVGAKAFFIGDQLGGTGWEVELADGSIEKYYVQLPESVGRTWFQFTNFPEVDDPELKSASVESLCTRYLQELQVIVDDAGRHFLQQEVVRAPVAAEPTARAIPSYLRRIK